MHDAHAPRGDADADPKTRKPQWRRWVGGVLVLLLVLLAAAPYVAQYPPVLDRLVARIAEQNNVRADVGGASLGWFTPLELRQVRVESAYGDPLLDIDRIQAEQPWWTFVFSGKRLGRFLIEQPSVTLIASSNGWNFEGIGPGPQPADEEAETASARKPELTAQVQGAAVRLFRVGVEEPLVDVTDMDVTVRIQYVDDTRWLIVQPFQPLNHEPLTPEMCGNGLELVAPILANVSWVEGDVSLEIDELRLPLNQPPGADGDATREPTAVAAGELTLHSVETGLKNPVLRQVAEKVAALFETRMPTRVRIADESKVHFELRDRRVSHEGLAFGLPEIAPSLLFRTSGTVGLDRSLDLRVEVPLALDLAFSGPLAKRLSGKTLRLAVTGTLDDPKVSLVPETTIVRQISELLRETPTEPGEAGEQAGDGVVTLAEDVLPLAREVGQDVVETLGDTLARIRERRAERRASRDEETTETRDDDGPADPSGDALPPPPLDEGADEAEGRPRRTGPLRRLFNRNRGDRGE